MNLSAAFHTTRLVLPGMRARNFGRIVNIASIYGLFATVNRVDYVTTKTALIGFTRAVALETAGQNITCNAICPGTVPTPAIEQRLAAVHGEGGPVARARPSRLSWRSRQPSGRFVAPERRRGAGRVAVRTGGADITGAAIPIDGGWSAS